MLQIVFFARVKEELACPGLKLQWGEALATVGSLKQHLADMGNGRWREVLSEENIICAVNHTVAADSAALVDGDEVAFYPPVTGG